MRQKTQTTGYNRPLGPSNQKPMTEAARKLLARSRGTPVSEMPRPLAPGQHVCDFGQMSKRCRRCGKAEGA
jgi:hypothetical protein